MNAKEAKCEARTDMGQGEKKTKTNKNNKNNARPDRQVTGKGEEKKKRPVAWPQY